MLEIVLGIDNIIFISIMAGKLSAEQRQKARVIGLVLAMVTRIALLFSIVWVMRLTQPLISLLNHEITGRDLVLLIGGLFLLAKCTHEIHDSLETHEAEEVKKMPPQNLFQLLHKSQFLILFSRLIRLLQRWGWPSMCPL